MWAGVDVGGRRKGFHVAVVDEDSLLAGPLRLLTASEVLEFVRRHAPRVIAVDSPRRAAPDGARSRDCERALAQAICRLRYTPDRERIAGNPYYEWIEHGFELYAFLQAEQWVIVECFPTASWTVWGGARRMLSRSRWSMTGLARLGLAGVPPRLSQDGRDAIAAAVTARLYDAGATDAFGDIVVPATGGQ